VALALYDSIRLDTDLDGDGLPVNTYEVAMEGYDDPMEVALQIEWGVTGKPLVHRVLSGGVPRTYQGRSYRLILTKAEKDQVLLDVGKILYFMPHSRDEDDTATYRSVVVFDKPRGITMYDPQQGWWHVDIRLIDGTDLTADT
jgi:hypothetical protein